MRLDTAIRVGVDTASGMWGLKPGAAGLEPLCSPDHSELEDPDGGTRSKGKASND
jgi:hypothetical protein